MSKITNDGLTRSDTGCIAVLNTHMATVGVKGLNELFFINVHAATITWISL